MLAKDRPTQSKPMQTARFGQAVSIGCKATRANMDSGAKEKEMGRKAQIMARAKAAVRGAKECTYVIQKAKKHKHT